jgi:hypothetical protein
MKKITNFTTTISLIQKSVQSNSPPSNIQNALSEQPDAVESLQASTRIAKSLLMEISRLWPGMAGKWASDNDMAMSWGRYIEQHKYSSAELRYALNIRPPSVYAPSIVELVGLLEEPKITREEAVSSFCRIAKICGYQLPEWDRVSPEELFAIEQFCGRAKLANSSTTDLNINIWHSLIVKAQSINNLPAQKKQEANLQICDKPRHSINIPDLLKMIMTNGTNAANKTFGITNIS